MALVLSQLFPFAGSAPENIGQIVADDLRNSGKFNPIPVSQMPQQPTTAAEVKPELGLL